MFAVQLEIDAIAAAQAVAHLPHTARHDADLVVKELLTAAFAGPAVRPWTIHRQEGRMVTVLGYSSLPEADLSQRLAMALPAVQRAVQALYAHEMPLLPQGARVRFSVRLCPTVNVTKSKTGDKRHGERDAFLAAIDRGEEGLSREGVYARYLADKLPGANIESVALRQFRLVRMSRPDRSGRGSTGFSGKTVPECMLEGVLLVTDPAAFYAALAQGVGRQRAYGRGHMRLEPMRMGALAA